MPLYGCRHIAAASNLHSRINSHISSPHRSCDKRPEHEGAASIVERPVVFRLGHATLIKMDFPSPWPVQCTVESSVTEGGNKGFYNLDWQAERGGGGKPESLYWIWIDDVSIDFISIFCSTESTSLQPTGVDALNLRNYPKKLKYHNPPPPKKCHRLWVLLWWWRTNGASK